MNLDKELLSYLGDVDTVGISNGDLLAWNSTTEEWESTTPATSSIAQENVLYVDTVNGDDGTGDGKITSIVDIV